MPLDQESGVVVRIWFSKNQWFYPLKFVEIKEGRPWVTTDVNRFTTLDVEGGMIVFPLDITTTIEPPGGAQLQWAIDEASIRVNHRIEEDMFTISPSLAKTVIDYDKELATLSQPQPKHQISGDGIRKTPPEMHSSQPSSWRYPLLIFNAAVIITLVSYLTYRHFIAV
jgi:hypothetical protein